MQTNMKILIACNILLLCVCAFLMIKLYVSPSIEHKHTVSDAIRSNEEVSISRSNGEVRISPASNFNNQPVSIQENALLETTRQNQADEFANNVVADNVSLSEQDLTDIELHLRDLSSSNFEPPAEDVLLHQRMLELERASETNEHTN